MFHLQWNLDLCEKMAKTAKSQSKTINWGASEYSTLSTAYQLYTNFSNTDKSW